MKHFCPILDTLKLSRRLQQNVRQLFKTLFRHERAYQAINKLKPPQNKAISNSMKARV
jgi:hypothetical protein